MEEVIEKLELLKEAGCKMVKCKVVDRNIELNKEIIELKKENKASKETINTLTNKLEKVVEDLKETIACLHESSKEMFIPISVIQNKIDEINRRIDYLNTELSKCYIEREKLGTETDIDNNETAIFCMEQEREYRYEQKRALQELLNERNK